MVTPICIKNAMMSMASILRNERRKMPSENPSVSPVKSSLVFSAINALIGDKSTSTKNSKIMKEMKPNKDFKFDTNQPISHQSSMNETPLPKELPPENRK